MSNAPASPSQLELGGIESCILTPYSAHNEFDTGIGFPVDTDGNSGLAY